MEKLSSFDFFIGKEELKNKTLKELSFGQRSITALDNKGIHTLEDILSFGLHYLNSIHGLGAGSRKEIDQIVSTLGLNYLSNLDFEARKSILLRNFGSDRFNNSSLEWLGLIRKCLNDLSNNNINNLGSLFVINYYQLQKMVDSASFKVIDETLNALELRLPGYISEEDKASFKQNGSKTPDAINYPIEVLDLCNLSLNSLKNSKIETIKDLSKLGFANIRDIRNIGNKGVCEITEKFHLAGFMFADEELVSEYQLNQSISTSMANNSIQILGLPITILHYLKKFNINTIGDLLQTNPEALKNLGMSDVALQELIQIITNKGLVFNTLVVDDELFVKQVYLKQLLRRKELLDKYEKLLQTKESLLLKEKDLDMEIDELILQMKSNDGVNYEFKK